MSLRRAPPLLLLGLCLSGLPPLPAPAAAQTVAVGFGPGWISRLATADGRLAGSSPEDERSIRAVLGGESGTIVSTQFETDISSTLALRLQAARMGTAMELDASSALLDGTGSLSLHLDDLGEVTVWMADLDVVVRPWPDRRPVRPYVGAGLGLTHWRMRGLEDLGVLRAFTGTDVGFDPVEATSGALAVFGGAEALLGERLRLRLEVLDQMGADPLEEEDFRLGSRFTGTAAPDRIVHQVRATLGVALAW